VPTSVRSYGKINIGLVLGPPRSDGFHELRTCYSTIALYDLIHVERQPGTGIEIRTTGDPELARKVSQSAFSAALISKPNSSSASTSPFPSKVESALPPLTPLPHSSPPSANSSTLSTPKTATPSAPKSAPTSPNFSSAVLPSASDAANKSSLFPTSPQSPQSSSPPPSESAPRKLSPTSIACSLPVR